MPPKVSKSKTGKFKKMGQTESQYGTSTNPKSVSGAGTPPKENNP